MTITHKLSIDLLRQENIAPIDAVQNDAGRVLALMLHANGIPWVIPQGVEVKVRYRKSDGIGGEYNVLPNGSSAWSMDGNVLTIALAPQVLTTAGEVALSVLLTKEHAAIHTFDIRLQVQPDLKDSITESESYVHCTGSADSLIQVGAKIMGGTIKSIILMGDDITDGAGGSAYNGSYTEAPSTNTAGYCWANAFGRFVSSRYGTKVRNMGMYGSVLASQTEELLKTVTKDDYVIWCTGTNDRDAAESYRQNLRRNLAAVREKSAGLLVISSLPALRADENNHATNMQTIDEIVSAAASGYVPFMSLYREFFQFCELRNIAFSDNFADLVHPNDWGHFNLFRILCIKLGLPMDPYTDYQYGGAWWRSFT